MPYAISTWFLKYSMPPETPVEPIVAERGKIRLNLESDSRFNVCGVSSGNPGELFPTCACRAVLSFAPALNESLLRAGFCRSTERGSADKEPPLFYLQA